MNNATLLALAEKWESEAKTPEIEDGSDSAKMMNAMARARRECKRECADTLRTLVSLLGGA